MIYLMPIYLIIEFIFIVKLMKAFPSKHKISQFLLLSFLFYLPVGWDVMLGRAYFNYHCEKDGGIHIYQTVELGNEYWNDDGSPKFYTERGSFDEEFFDGRYEKKQDDDRTFETMLPVSRYLLQIIDTNTGYVAGEIVTYQYTNGWVWNTGQPFSTRGIMCPQVFDFPTPSDLVDNPLANGKGSQLYRKLHSYIFLNASRKEAEQ